VDPLGPPTKRGFDSNKREQARIVDEISELLGLDPDGVEKLRNGSIRDITEYGRIVHAEMEALLMCSRNNMSTRGATLYCTTFPCHNCAKHVIAAGIKEVVYIEPYPKSQAFKFHTDSITEDPLSRGKVLFRPFVGIGPRRFFELFSMNSGFGFQKKRKSRDGNILEWRPGEANLRSQLLPCDYLDSEAAATEIYLKKWGMTQDDTGTEPSEPAN
jgi:deoxycytidylate deaminase